MKKFQSFVITALVTLTAFSAVLYTSCTKNKCSGVACYNGGTCSGGNCLCPSGYSGSNCELSSIVYQNNSFTTVNITVGNATGTIDPNGGTAIFSGTAGNSVNVTASTSGSVGETINWSFTDNFPTNGNTLTEPLNVSAAYFYLEVANYYYSSINSMTTNIGLPSALTENVSVPANGSTYGMGYYLGFSNTSVYFTFTDATFTTYSNLVIPNQDNAYYLINVH